MQHFQSVVFRCRGLIETLKWSALIAIKRFALNIIDRICYRVSIGNFPCFCNKSIDREQPSVFIIITNKSFPAYVCHPFQLNYPLNQLCTPSSSLQLLGFARATSTINIRWFSLLLSIPSSCSGISAWQILQCQDNEMTSSG